MEEQEKLDKNRPRSTSPDVKSRAVVKYTAVQVPVNFAQLKCNTDLKMPPSNWLSSAADSYGLRHSQTVGFSSFRLAHMFPDCVGEVDVVSGAECIKALLKLPYHPNSLISVIVHRVENTILLDDFNILQYLMKPEWSWMKQFFYGNVIKSMRGKDKVMYIKNKTRLALQQKNLVSKFLYHSLIPSQKCEYENDTTKEIPSFQLPGPELPEPDVKENIPDPTFSNHTYNRNVLWTFEDIRMLIGSDMPIFGGVDRPCISLRLRDASEPISVLTGIDYWLDNLMCNVPEVVMCYHLDGIVQKYEPIKTEDLPNLANSKFSPKVIRNVAQNILSFLKSNATKAGHTYWLFKGTHDDVVKLYDLTSLCNMTNDETSTSENPFTIPVAMLLYRVARNMKPPCQAGHIRMLLENCIKLLPAEKFPQIVASCHFMLANLYVPPNTNPENPCYKESSSECECGDPSTCRRRDEDEDVGVSFVRDPNEKQDSKEFMSKSKITNIGEKSTHDDTSAPKKGNDISISKDVTVNSLKNPIEMTPDNPPPPLVDERIGDRCSLALKHIRDGLHVLELEDLNKKNNSKPKKSKSDRVEESPQVAKPSVPIPMAYESLNVNKKQPNTENDALTKGAGVELDKNGKNSKKKKKKKLSAENSKSESESIYQNQDSALLKKDKSLPTWQGDNNESSLSWNVHLKILLYEKSCLSFAIMAEQHYKDVQYGLSFKYLLLVKKARDISMILNNSDIVDYSCMLGRAGDLLVHFSKEWDKYLECYLKEISTLSDVEQEIMKSIKKDIKLYGKGGQNGRRSDMFDITELPKSILEAMKSSQDFYNEALKSTNENKRIGLLKRLGSVKNEIGVRYMYEAQNEYAKYYESTEKIDRRKEQLYVTYSKLSFRQLVDATQIFQEINDFPNLALLHCNMGRYKRFRAHCDVATNSPEQKKYYSQAAEQYGYALKLLSPPECETLRDLVKWELSSTLYSQACILQDAPSDDQDAASVAAESLRLALKYCPLTPGPRQCLYQFRAATLHQRLASLFHKQYRDTSIDTSKRKGMFALSRIHYEKAATILLSIEETVMFLTVQLEHVALLEFQTSIGSGNKLKSLQNALDLLRHSESIINLIALKNIRNADNEDESVTKISSDKFSLENNTNVSHTKISAENATAKTVDNKDNCEQNDDELLTELDDTEATSEFNLLTLFSQRLQWVLKSLIQLCLQKHLSISKEECDELMAIYKGMYSEALKINKLTVKSSQELAKHLLETLSTLKDCEKKADS